MSWFTFGGVLILKLNEKQLAQLIDHTFLKPTATVRDIKILCNEAKKYGFYSVCVNPCYVELAADLLTDSEVQVCTVVGFPLGANTIQQKQREAADAVSDGATEIDMVAALGALKDGNWGYVERDIEAVRESIGQDIILKVILESSVLTEEELIQASKVAMDAGADFVKTSTGFAQGGATTRAVSIMRNTVGPDKGVKASGGIRTLSQAIAMIEAGANRLGCSLGVKIMKEMLRIDAV